MSWSDNKGCWGTRGSGIPHGVKKYRAKPKMLSPRELRDKLNGFRKD